MVFREMNTKDRIKRKSQNQWARKTLLQKWHIVIETKEIIILIAIDNNECTSDKDCSETGSNIAFTVVLVPVWKPKSHVIKWHWSSLHPNPKTQVELCH